MYRGQKIFRISCLGVADERWLRQRWLTFHSSAAQTEARLRRGLELVEQGLAHTHANPARFPRLLSQRLRPTKLHPRNLAHRRPPLWICRIRRAGGRITGAL